MLPSHGAVHPPTGAWARPACSKSLFCPDAGGREPYARVRKVTAGAHPPSEPEDNLTKVCEIVDVHLQPLIRTEPMGVGVVGWVLRHLPGGGHDMVNTSMLDGPHRQGSAPHIRNNHGLSGVVIPTIFIIF